MQVIHLRWVGCLEELKDTCWTKYFLTSAKLYPLIGFSFKSKGVVCRNFFFFLNYVQWWTWWLPVGWWAQTHLCLIVWKAFNWSKGSLENCPVIGFKYLFLSEKGEKHLTLDLMIICMELLVVIMYNNKRGPWAMVKWSRMLILEETSSYNPNPGWTAITG